MDCASGFASGNSFSASGWCFLNPFPSLPDIIHIPFSMSGLHMTSLLWYPAAQFPSLMLMFIFGCIFRISLPNDELSSSNMCDNCNLLLVMSCSIWDTVAISSFAMLIRSPAAPSPNSSVIIAFRCVLNLVLMVILSLES